MERSRLFVGGGFVVALALAATFLGMVRRTVPQDLGRAQETPWAFVMEDRSRPNGPSFLDLAVWDDGAYLYLKILKEPKQPTSYAIGKMTDATLKELKSSIEQDGLVKIKLRNYAVPDSSHTRMVLPDEKGLLRSSHWDQRIARGWGANSKGEQEYRDFAKAWVGTRITLTAATSAVDAELTAAFHKDGTFRGFDPRVEMSKIRWITDTFKREAEEQSRKGEK